MTPDKLYKTTIVIWTEYDPDGVDIDYLGRDAIYGDAYCSSVERECIEDSSLFPDTEFFGVYDLDEDDIIFE